MLAANFVTSHCTYHLPGDIESLKDCPFQVLNLAGEFRNPSKLTGKCNRVGRVLPRTSPLLGTFPGTFFISPHPSSTYPIAPGDIEVFKGMPLISLNLYNCQKLTGVFGRRQGMVDGVKIGNRCGPKASCTSLRRSSPVTTIYHAQLEPISR